MNLPLVNVFELVNVVFDATPNSVKDVLRHKLKLIQRIGNLIQD
jgi:hypothetical protein